MWTPPQPPYPACPECTCAEVECLVGLSERAERDYLRCTECGHIWTIDRPPAGDPCEQVDEKSA